MRNYKQLGAQRGYGGPKWNVMWCERDDTRYVTAKHVKCNWIKREVTSYRYDKKRNVECQKRLNAIPSFIIQFMTSCISRTFPTVMIT